MEGMGLVAYVEKQLEQDIALKRLPHGHFASERKMARGFGVSRGTVREALRRLGARGLVMQRSGRMARAVAPEMSLTLENLGVALHDERSTEGRWLLEGFFGLKRQVLVELLVDCCEKASEAALHDLRIACFGLRDAGHWEESGERCARLEFELLRLAARMADRPGHLLLIQSLQRALWGSAAKLLPLMGGKPVGEWALCAMMALGERDVEALRRTLPGLLRACDERVLERFSPTPSPPSPDAPEEHHAQPCIPEAPVASAQDTPAEADSRPEACVPGATVGSLSTVSPAGLLRPRSISDPWTERLRRFLRRRLIPPALLDWQGVSRWIRRRTSGPLPTRLSNP
jgi:GntR family transcriptional regulator, transcriptional repressor for pyruvate dehydrogenase complex